MSFAAWLQPALRAIINSGGVRDAVLERGEPLMNPFFWPETGHLRGVELEAFYLADSAWLPRWRPAETHFQRCLRRLMWEAHVPDSAAAVPAIDAALARFDERTRLKMGEFDVLLDTEGVSHKDPPMKALECTFGRLLELVPEAWREAVENEWEDDGRLWVTTRVEAPTWGDDFKESLVAADAADRKVSSALDIFATLVHRVGAAIGDPTLARVGERFAILRGESPLDAGFRAREGPKLPLLALDGARVKHPRLQEGATPWEQFPPESEMARVVRAAYERFGRATRLAGEPEAAMPLALSALELLALAPGELSGKRAKLAARMLHAAALTGAGTMHPKEVVVIYGDRNALLHDFGDAPPHIRSRDDMDRLLRRLYRVLDLLTHAAVQQGVTTRRDFVASLNASGKTDEIRGTIQQEKADLINTKNAAITREFKRMIGRGIASWDEIAKEV